MKTLEKCEKWNINEYQEYIKKALTKRGFINQGVEVRLNLLIEEIGELSKAIRKKTNQKVDEKSTIMNLEEELADVFFVLLSIANIYNIDISSSFKMKENINNKRIWK